MIVLLLLLLHTPVDNPAVTDLQDDERLILFHTHAAFDSRKSVWRVHVHGWLFEPERGSLKRRALMAAVREAVGVPKAHGSQPVGLSRRLFKQRFSRFLVDNERGKPVVVHLRTRRHVIGRTNEAGHVQHAFDVSPEEFAALKKRRSRTENRWKLRAVLPPEERRTVNGTVQFVPRRGWSVISDIDDTIKITNVNDRSEMLANTFVRPFRPVKGMPELYRTLQKRGAVFHYVSGSPWQLYEPLRTFLVAQKFPSGPMHLRHFRLIDVRSLKQLTSPENKQKAIAGLLREFPQRQFLFFGDSGERDPEIYGEIARRFPKQVRGVFIRDVTDESKDDERYRKAFRGVDPKTWRIFKDPKEIAENLKRLVEKN